VTFGERSPRGAIAHQCTEQADVPAGRPSVPFRTETSPRARGFRPSRFHSARILRKTAAPFHLGDDDRGRQPLRFGSQAGTLPCAPSALRDPPRLSQRGLFLSPELRPCFTFVMAGSPSASTVDRQPNLLPRLRPPLCHSLGSSRRGGFFAATQDRQATPRWEGGEHDIEPRE
jgi:hypothetical protein